MAQTSIITLKTSDLLDRKTLCYLRERSEFISSLLVLHAWSIIVLAMMLFFFFPNPLTYVLAVMLIGARQLGLAVIMHDAAHNALSRNHDFNDILSNFLCAYPLFARTEIYRRYHLKHHRYTQQEEDPDLVLSKPFPITRKSFMRKMFRDLTGQTAFHQRKAQFLDAIGGKDLSPINRIYHFWQKLGYEIIANIVIFILCSLIFHWSFYLTLWLIPFVTYNMAITRIRSIAEHALVPDDNDPFRNARSTKANWLVRIFLAPYWVNYHVEHHLFMYVPCWKLKQTHNVFRENGYFNRMETATGYIDVLIKACSKRDDEENRGSFISNPKQRLKGYFSEGFSSSQSTHD